MKGGMEPCQRSKTEKEGGKETNDEETQGSDGAAGVSRFIFILSETCPFTL